MRELKPNKEKRLVCPREMLGPNWKGDWHDHVAMGNFILFYVMKLGYH